MTPTPRQTLLVHGARSSYAEELVELLRILVVGGVPLGVLVAGLGSRLAMLVLRLTSPDSVRGVRSDDGFVIGQVTLGGTYQLLSLGAAVGIIGAAAYVAVAPWLIGPRWLRSVTVGATAGALVGSMVIHPQGIDFTVLSPVWLAVLLFVALPVLTGLLLPLSVDAAASPDSWAARGRQRWVVPAALLLLFPLALVVGLVVAAIVALLLPVRRAFLTRLSRSAAATWVLRVAFALIPVAAGLALAGDLAELF
ncbi:membrane hypothetical protein [metagenome]|uniref:Uncharacterized protein n=1 Tax=metagenome TaxID=256318 RepID=A0A2P2C6M5_9ZZZZ